MKQRLSGGIPNFNVVIARLQGKFLKLSRHSGKTAVNVDFLHLSNVFES